MLHASYNRLRTLVEQAGDIVWTVDLEMRPTYISPCIERHLGYGVEEAFALRMEEMFTADSLDAVMSVLHKELENEKRPDLDPDRTVLLEIQLVHKDGHIVPFEAHYSFLRDEAGTPTEVLAVVRDLSARRAAEENHRRTTRRLIDSLQDTIQALAMLCEMRDPYTAGHQRRVATLVSAIGARMGLSSSTVEGMRVAALIHDIGKVRVPVEILTSPRRLSAAEFDIIKMHPAIGHEILRGIEFPWPIADAIYQHHERLNGSGYPLGIKGKGISLEARILAIADVVEAIASDRPYRPALGIGAALEEIASHKDELYDAVAVDACIAVFRQDGYQFEQPPALRGLE